jgi:hypothetical protein
MGYPPRRWRRLGERHPQRYANQAQILRYIPPPLEHVFHRELYHPGRRRGRRVRRSVRSSGTECRAEVRPGGASEGATVAEAESNAIRYVVELSADLEGLAFLDPEASGNRLIPLPKCRSEQTVGAHIAEPTIRHSTVRRLGKCGWV